MMVLLAAIALFTPDIYYVSPKGDDASDGRSEAKAWRSVAKVNAASFNPGDQILFARGGEWRDSLKAGSSGAAGKPIVYGAYGKGEKPRFWGSDPVIVGADGTAISEKPVAALLANHVFVAPGSWSWAGGILKARPGSYTACVRVDPVHSNGRSHLVFRDLVADESADVRDGYGFRVMGSDDVRLEDCEAYRAGRHHFGAINSSNFVGVRLKCSTAMPNIPGGATFFVSFSDASRKGDAHQWIDCSAEHLENPGQRNYQAFYDHGEGLGPILIQNLTSHGGMLSVGSSSAAPITVKGGLLDDAGLEVFGDHFRADGLTIRGNGAVDLWCSDSVVENLLLLVEPKNGGPTGYGAGFVFREGARRNTIRYSTVLLGDAPCLVFTKGGLEPKIQGNVLLSKKGVFGNENSIPLDGNFSAGDAGLDAQYKPRTGSPLIAAGKTEHPDHDLAGKKRPATCTLGAFEPGK
jgi:hypothetical protein